MFTGLIETLGTVRRIKHREGGMLLGVEPDSVDFGIKIGESVAIDGACLTMEFSEGHVAFFTAVRETLDRTTIGEATPGRRVNMERALKVGGRLDGHMVLGHIDGVARIISDQRYGAQLRRTFEIPTDLGRYIAGKGSIAIDGISLTVADVIDNVFTVAIIPHTFAVTTMTNKKPGDRVNIECDVLARYLERLMVMREKDSAGESLMNRMERLGF